MRAEEEEELLRLEACSAAGDFQRCRDVDFPRSISMHEKRIIRIKKFRIYDIPCKYREKSRQVVKTG